MIRVPLLFALEWCAGHLDRLEPWDADAWNYLPTAKKPLG
jgi:hypothetical protein